MNAIDADIFGTTFLLKLRKCFYENYMNLIEKIDFQSERIQKLESKIIKYQSELTALRQECGVLRRALKRCDTFLLNNYPYASIPNICDEISKALSQSPISAKQQAIQEAMEKVIKCARYTRIEKKGFFELEDAIDALDDITKEKE